MPNVTISREFFVNEALSRVSGAAQMLHLGLRVIADQYGRFLWNASVIREMVAPYSKEFWVESYLRELETAGSISRVVIGGVEFGQLDLNYAGVTVHSAAGLILSGFLTPEQFSRDIYSYKCKKIEGCGEKEKTRKSPGRKPSQVPEEVAALIDLHRADYRELVDPEAKWGAPSEADKRAAVTLLNLYGKDHTRAMWRWAMQDKQPATQRNPDCVGWHNRVRTIAQVARFHATFDSKVRGIGRTPTADEKWDEMERQYTQSYAAQRSDS